ncbi:MAG TPA: PadR family transcriptional regulator [Cytophagales bacterium]|nr:PadR family transcriptional regulator [Cytophagales bacterium]HAP60334.1 PadR family transcriptional regulator [Cytophagales bacterium]
MKGSHLGEFEELVLLAVASLYGKAYGNAIQEVLTDQAQRPVKLSTIHVALQRLEEKGYLASSFGETTPQRGGRRKKYFEVTTLGFQTLQQAKEVRAQLWNMVPKQALR